MLNPGTCDGTGGDAKDTDRTCEVCPAGKYSNSNDDTPCADCPLGHWCDTRSVEPTPCSACPPGEGETDPGDCGDTGGDRDRTCEACLAGTFSNTNDVKPCESCGEGHHCPAGAKEPVQCQQCPPGSGQADAGDCEAGGAQDRTCAKCEAGKFSRTTDAGECEPCGKGNYCLLGAKEPLPCTVCPPGRGMVDPGTCAQGGGRDRQCAACGPGQYSAGEDGSPCKACGSNKFGTTAAAREPGEACHDCMRQGWEGPDELKYDDAPESAFCPGGSVRLVKKGFWRAPAPGNHTASAGLLTYKVCV